MAASQSGPEWLLKLVSESIKSSLPFEASQSEGRQLSSPFHSTGSLTGFNLGARKMEICGRGTDFGELAGIYVADAGRRRWP